MYNRLFCRMSAFAGLLFISFSLAYGQSPKPNILLITVDDLNDYVGFLEGHPQVETPNMDALARDGIVFENAYCTSPSCAPSRTSMLTGKLPGYTGIYENVIYTEADTFRTLFSDASSNETVFTLPEVLKDKGGYFTYNLLKIFHGWSIQGFDNDFDDLTTDPCAKGKSWSKFIDFRPNSNPTPVSSAPYHHGFERYKFGPLQDSQEPEMSEVKCVDSLLFFLDRYESLPSDYCDRPFFVAFGTAKPHVPYYVPRRYFLPFYEDDIYALPYDIPYNSPSNLFPPNGLVMPTRFPNGQSGREDLGLVGANNAKGQFNTEEIFTEYAEELTPKPVIDPSLDPAEIDSIIEEAKKSQAVMSYLASIKFADFQIGRILRELDQRPALRENTIIVLVSDHGYSLGEREHWHKFGLWETDIRVPMIIVDPRNSTVGKRSQEVVSLVDVFPTILELSGVAAPTFPDGSPYLDGRSLVPFLNNPTLRTSNAEVTTYKGPDRLPEGSCFPHYSVRSDQFHYVYHRTNAAFTDSTGTPCDFPNSRLEEELYEVGANREVDPEEFVNLIGDPAYEQEVLYLSQWLPGGVFDSPQSPPRLQIDPSTIPCLLSSSDTINPAFMLTNANGIPTTILPEYTFTWKIDPPGWEVPNGSPMDLSMLPATAHDLPLRLSIRMENSLDTTYFLYHSMPIQLYSSLPDLSFDVSLDGRMLIVDNYNLSWKAAETTWSYGDGFVFTADEAPRHQFSAPGAYEIKRSVKFGEGAECLLTHEKISVVPTSIFPSDTCYTPGSLEVSQVSSAKGKFNWSEVAGATSYKLRAKRARSQFDDTWLFLDVPTTSYTTPTALVSNTEYLIQVAGICPSGISDYSHPVFFTTPKCDPPSNLQAIFLEPDRAIINWAQNPDPTVSGAQVGYVEVGLINVITRSYSSSVSTFELTPLNPGTNYQMRAWSKCQQFSGPAVLGEISDGRFFTTPTVKALARFSVELFPNPVVDYLHLSLNPAEGLPIEPTEKIVLAISDPSGKVHITKELELADLRNVMTINMTGLNEGVYFLRLKSNNLIDTWPIVKH